MFVLFVFVLYSKCCQFRWIVLFWLPIRLLPSFYLQKPPIWTQILHWNLNELLDRLVWNTTINMNIDINNSTNKNKLKLKNNNKITTLWMSWVSNQVVLLDISTSEILSFYLMLLIKLKVILLQEYVISAQLTILFMPFLLTTQAPGLALFFFNYLYFFCMFVFVYVYQMLPLSLEYPIFSFL